jgi:two-component system, sensor histidine kinase and response regulator
MNYLSFISHIYHKISTIGYSNDLPNYEKKRVLVFNQLNFAAFVFSLFRAIYIATKIPSYFTWSIFFVNLGLVATFLLLMWFMKKQYFAAATLISFLMVPPILAYTCWVSKDEGLDMFVINYMMFCFFFLRRFRNSLIAFVYCFAVFIIVHFKLESDIALKNGNTPVFVLTVFNYIVAFIMFFSTLALIKYQVWKYEKSIRRKTKDLEERNMEIEIKNDTLHMQSDILEEKTKQLTELNSVKTKLFSVISHDLRTSIYSFKNIIDSYKAGYISNEELLNELPDLSNEIDSCTEVMENLISWGKDQFKDRRLIPENININQLTNSAYKSIQARCAKKEIEFLNNVATNIFAYADKQMIQIVLRNLISNAVKFTSNGGSIIVSAEKDENFTTIFVKDTGIGMAKNDVDKFMQNKFFSNEGTNNEIGTGLGLIICKDFIYENNGTLNIETKVGEGSMFIVTIPAKEKIT